MFGQDNDGGGDGPTQSQDPGQVVDLNTLPKPRLRAFRVTRHDVTEREVNNSPVFKTDIINAHTLAMGEDDRTVFQTYVVDEVLSMFNRQPFHLLVTRILTGVIEVEDVTPAAESARIIH